MDHATLGRHSAAPHYAKVVAIGAALALVLFLMMPFAAGPMGVGFSGWTMLGQAKPIMMLAILTGMVFGLFGVYVLCTMAGGVALLLLFRAAGQVEQTASTMLANNTQSLDTVGGAATYLMANQIGLQWGAGFAFLAAAALTASILFYRR